MDNISEKTARSVTLKQFGDFIRENLHLTWCLGEGGCFSTLGREKKGWPAFKYFYPSIDTRTMTIFHITTDKYEVDFREEFDGTILDLLLHKMNIEKTMANSSVEKDYKKKIMKFVDTESAKLNLEDAIERLQKQEEKHRKSS